MIFHSPVAFGRDEKARESVKRLQLALEKLAQATGNDKYNPRKYGGYPAGIVDATTIWALAQAAGDGLAQVPGVDWFIDKIFGAADKVGGFWTFQQIYNPPGPIPSPIEDEIDPWIERHADRIKSAVEAAANAVGGGGPAVMQVATMVPQQQQLQVKTAKVVSQYPAGSFAIRDPKLNQYRILVPIE